VLRVFAASGLPSAAPFSSLSLGGKFLHATRRISHTSCGKEFSYVASRAEFDTRYLSNSARCSMSSSG